MQFVVRDACDGVDVLNGWWNGRLQHSVRVSPLIWLLILTLHSDYTDPGARHQLHRPGPVVGPFLETVPGSCLVSIR